MAISNQLSVKTCDESHDYKRVYYRCQPLLFSGRSYTIHGGFTEDFFVSGGTWVCEIQYSLSP